MPLLGLDVGTTGCKASLFDESGALLAAAYREYPTEQPAPGAYELNPQRVWEAVRQVIAEATAAAPRAQVRALCVSSLGETVVPVGRDGRVLDNAILYMDQRGKEQAAALERTVGGDRVMEIAGVPLHPMFSLPKTMWLREHRPELYGEVWKFMLFGDFIGYLLTGESVTDYTLASRTMGLDVAAKKWDASLFEAAGIDMDKFPALVASGEPIGVVRREVAEALGLEAGTLVVAGGHDQACAALGAGVLRGGEAVDGIGTVECLTPAYDAPITTPQMLEYRFNCAPHVVEGLYLTYAFNFTGGSLLRWFRDQFGQTAAAEARRAGMSVYDYLNATAAAVPTDLLVVPHFAGSGTPYMNPDARGAIYGLTLGTDAPQLYRAMMEGVTYEMRYNLDCLKEAGIRVDSLCAVGGGAKSDLWLQIKADIMDVPIRRLDAAEAGTLGSIMLAGRAAGVYRSYEEAAAQLVRPLRTFEPQQPSRALYAERYEQYKRLSRALAAM